MKIKAKVTKGIIRHLAGGAGAGIIGYALGAGIEPDTLLNILEWIEYVAGLLLLVSAAGASALDKVKTQKDIEITIQQIKEESKDDKPHYNS